MTKPITPIFDAQHALEQAGGDENLAKELFGMLLQETPLLVERIGQAITEEEFDLMWEHAHKLYGSTAYCGVPQLRERAKALEDIIKQKDHIEMIKDEYNALRMAVDELLQQGDRLLQESWN